MRDSDWPSWFIAPRGEVFSGVSLTNAKREPSCSRKANDRSKIDRNALDLCGMATMGEIFNCGGGLSLMSSYKTILACPDATFSLHSSAKCSNASVDSADL